MAAAPRNAGNILGSRISARLPRYVALGVVLVALSVLAAGAAAAPAESLGAAVQQPSFTATPLVPVSRVEGFKSASGQLAQTDESLLGLRSDAPVNVVVKLDYDSVAAYAGLIDGLPATSPSVTGEPLTMRERRDPGLPRLRAGHRAAVPRAPGRTGSRRGRRTRAAHRLRRHRPDRARQRDRRAPEAARRRRSPGRQPREAAHRLEPRLHRRPDDLRPARRQRQRGRARASSSASSTPAPGRSIRPSPIPAPCRPRRPPPTARRGCATSATTR